jgi:hypothetical protein
MVSSIKEKIVKEFISLNYRAPSQQEIKTLYNAFVVENSGAENTGITSSQKNNYPIVGKVSSAKQFNELINDLRLDQKQSLASSSELLESLETKFKVFNKKINNSLGILDRMERNVNKDLLLHLKEDIYTYGIIEAFQDYDKVDFAKSNITFFNGKVTVGFTKISSDEFHQNQISYSVVSRSGNLLKQKEVSTLGNIVKEDGRHFKVVAYSKYPDDTCEMVINIDFPEADGANVGTLKFTTLTPEINSKVSYKCYYSKDLVSLNPVFDSGLRIKAGENFIEVNQNKIKRIKLILTKQNYDFKESDEFAYVFSLDFLGHTKNSYKLNTASVLYLGPYEMLDEDDNPVNYSMATVKGGTCCIVPDESSIDMYLSKDNINWIKTDFNGNTKQVVQFEESEENHSDLSLVEVIDTNALSTFIAENNLPSDVRLSAGEKLLNIFIPIANKSKFIKSSLKIKRNVANKNNEKLYSATSGWAKIENDFYATTFEIKQMEGRYIDFGPNHCFINNRMVSGKIFLAQGSYRLKTSTENWFDLDLEIEREVKTSRQLKQVDALYPYNHKYIIEGFSYSSDFRGKKAYTGADEVYLHLMKEVSNQRFSINSTLDIYTIVETLTGLYFKIKTKSNSSESKIEDFNLSYRKRGDSPDGNKLYIKAILKTFNENVTPKIEQIQVRVI